MCAVSEALCLASDGHYTESGNCLVSDEEKGRRACSTGVSYLRQRETRDMGARLPFTLLHKKECQQNILHAVLLTPACA
jgi:hypothetical protein